MGPVVAEDLVDCHLDLGLEADYHLELGLEVDSAGFHPDLGPEAERLALGRFGCPDYPLGVAAELVHPGWRCLGFPLGEVVELAHLGSDYRWRS